MKKYSEELVKSDFIGLMLLLALAFAGCSGGTRQGNGMEDSISVVEDSMLEDKVNLVPELTLICQNDSFASFLRSLPRKDKSEVVKSFYGDDAGMEGNKYCVIDFPLLSDIEQCADVCMHLRAEFLFRQREFGKIHFHDINGGDHHYGGGASRDELNRYLRRIYAMSNTYSMSEEMTTVPSFKDMKPGDVFINPADGGMLGHAIIIMDVAHDADGNIYYQVAQGFTPACDLHIICNSGDEGLSPWFRLKPDSDAVSIAGFVFDSSQLKRWNE